MQFDLNRNIDGAALDVQTALTVAARRLPVEMTTPPFFRKVNPGDFPVLFISLNSPTLPMSTVDEYGQTVLAQQISQLPGVAQVLVYGGQKFAVRVQADPVAAAARNISLEDIRTALAKTNSNTPVGTIAGERQNITLVGLRRASARRRTIARSSSPTATARRSSSTRSRTSSTASRTTRIASFFNGNRSVVLAIQRQPDANTVAVVDSVKERIPAYRSQIPAAINMQVLMDRSISVRESVHDVQETLLIAIGLVILVIFLFLRTVSATIIPALAVPISLIATCAVMYAFNFSINNMTLLALTLSVGFVVDDAIVMLENIVRHIEGGMRPFEAALKGAREIGFTIISITVSLIAVFIPVLLMGGMVGRVFREFAVTIAVAIIVSGFVSLTLTPMLCARVLRTHHEGEKQNVVLRALRADVQFVAPRLRVDARQGAQIQVDHPDGDARHDGGHGLSLRRDPEGLLPGRGHRLHLGHGRGTGRHLVPRHARAAARRSPRSIRKDPAVAYVNSTVGVGGPNATNNTGRMFVGLKPKKERGPLGAGAAAAAPRHRAAWSAWRSTTARSRTSISADASPRANSSTRCSRARPRRSIACRDEMLEKIKTIAGLRDVNSDLYIKNPEIEIEIDREKAAFYGISVDQIRQELYNAFGNRQVATIYTPINDYQIILETRPEFQADTDRPVEDLSQDQPRQHHRGRHRRRRRHGHRHAERHVDPDQRGDAAGAEGRTAAGQPPGPAALGHDLVQPRSGHLARSGGRRDPADRARTRTCRCRSPPASRATRRCSRSR